MKRVATLSPPAEGDGLPATDGRPPTTDDGLLSTGDDRLPAAGSGSAADYGSPYLHREVAATREVLDGLLTLWRGQSGMTIDDARRLSVLVFNGARAVAFLLYHQARLNNLTPETNWMDGVLDELSEEWGVEL